MDIKTTTTILLGIGIVIILLCLLTFILPSLAKLRESRQKFKGLGVELEMSTMMLVFLIGVLLTLPGFYFNIKDYEEEISRTESEFTEKIEKIQRENESLKRMIDEAKRYDIVAILEFTPNESPNVTSLRNLDCQYSTWKRKEEEMIRASEVQPGPTAGSLRVRIRDLERDDLITIIQVTNRADNTRWTYEKPYNPVEPNFQMKKLNP